MNTYNGLIPINSLNDEQWKSVTLTYLEQALCAALSTIKCITKNLKDDDALSSCEVDDIKDCVCIINKIVCTYGKIMEKDTLDEHIDPNVNK